MKKTSKKICIENECTKSVFARNMCRKHYNKWHNSLCGKGNRIPTEDKLYKGITKQKKICECGNEKSVQAKVCRECWRISRLDKKYTHTKYDDLKEIPFEKIKEIVEESKSYKDVYTKLKVSSYLLYQLRKEFDLDERLDLSHFDRPNAVGNNFNRMFSKNSITDSGNIRKKIIKDKLLPYVCKICNMKPIWQGKILKLHLDHIDGNNKNNKLENLRFLCPNCHSQTFTHSCSVVTDFEKELIA